MQKIIILSNFSPKRANFGGFEGPAPRDQGQKWLKIAYFDYLSHYQPKTA